jgi:hypothetical protein
MKMKMQRVLTYDDLLGMLVDVYLNVVTQQYSIRYHGKVIAHLPEVVLDNATFHVNQRERYRARTEGRKNVHAHVTGTVTDRRDGAIHVTYDPYKTPLFMCDGRPIRTAARVELKRRLGAVTVGHTVVV